MRTLQTTGLGGLRAQSFMELQEQEVSEHRALGPPGKVGERRDTTRLRNLRTDIPQLLTCSTSISPQTSLLLSRPKG